MPAAMSYTPNDDHIREAAQSERLTRETAANKAVAYYRGQHAKPLKKNPREPDLNVVMNLFKMRIDRRRDFLFPALPDIELGDDTDTAATADETWLDQAWASNGGAVLAGKMVLDGSRFGHVYVRMLPPGARGIFPRVRLLNNIITFWQADDVATPLWHEVQWTVGKITYRQDILDLETLGMGSGYEIRQYQAAQNNTGKGEGWSADGVIAWPYDTPPIIDWQHWPEERIYYGSGEDGDLDLNDAVNRVLSQANAVIRNHAFPKTIATGVSAGKVEVATAIDSFWTIQNPNAKVYNLEMQSDLTAIMNMANALKEAYTSQGRVVLLSGQPSEFARLTNLAVRTVFMDMINANNTLRSTYGSGIKRICEAMLTMAGRDAGYDVTLNWDDALPENDLEQAQVIQLLRGMGLISKQTSAGEIGLDWEQETARMEDEDDGNAALLQKLIRTGGNSPFQIGSPTPAVDNAAPVPANDGVPA